MSDKPLFVRYCAKDFLSGTQTLKPLEDLAYRRICDVIYVTGNRLLDDDELPRITKTGDEWSAVRQGLIAKKKIRISRGRIVVKRCTDELNAVKVAQNKLKNASKKGVEARKKNAKTRTRQKADKTLTGKHNRPRSSPTVEPPVKPPVAPSVAPMVQPNHKPLTNSKKTPPPDSSTELRATSLSDEVVVVVSKMLEQADPRWATRSVGTVRQWIADGADAETHIYPVIRQGIERGMASKISTLSYFTPAVERLMAERPAARRAVPDPTLDTPRAKALHLAQDQGDGEFEYEICTTLRDKGTDAADRLGKQYLERQHAAAQEA